MLEEGEREEQRRRQRNDICSVVGKALIYVGIIGGCCYLAYRLVQ